MKSAKPKKPRAPKSAPDDAFERAHGFPARRIAGVDEVDRKSVV
jgi:hypothetical protein